jgi:plastocyanin
MALLSVLLLGCGDDDPQSGEKSAPASVEVKIEEFKFPPTTTVRAGGSIVFLNRDKAPHTAEAETFDSGRLDRGESKRIKFDEPGTYEYFCDFHRFMTGTVEVTG